MVDRCSNRLPLPWREGVGRRGRSGTDGGGTHPARQPPPSRGAGVHCATPPTDPVPCVPLALAAALAAMPVLALAVMAGSGWAAPVPALVAIVLTLAVALGVAILWTRDVGVLTEAVRGLAADAPAPRSARPALAVLEELDRGG